MTLGLFGAPENTLGQNRLRKLQKKLLKTLTAASVITYCLSTFDKLLTLLPLNSIFVKKSMYGTHFAVSLLSGYRHLFYRMCTQKSR